MVVSEFPFAIDTIAIKITAIVVDFIPPAVEPGLPPIIMSVIERRTEEGDIWL